MGLKNRTPGPRSFDWRGTVGMSEKLRLRAGGRNGGYCRVRPTSLSCPTLMIEGKIFGTISGFVTRLGEGVLQFSRHLSKCVRKGILHDGTDRCGWNWHALLPLRFPPDAKP